MRVSLPDLVCLDTVVLNRPLASMPLHADDRVAGYGPFTVRDAETVTARVDPSGKVRLSTDGGCYVAMVTSQHGAAFESIIPPWAAERVLGCTVCYPGGAAGPPARCADHIGTLCSTVPVGSALTAFHLPAGCRLCSWYVGSRPAPTSGDKETVVMTNVNTAGRNIYRTRIAYSTEILSALLVFGTSRRMRAAVQDEPFDVVMRLVGGWCLDEFCAAINDPQN